MPKLAVSILAAAVALAAAASAASPPAGKPSLRLLRMHPLTVVGQRFARHEKVRVELSGDVTGVRRAVSGATGSFAVRFGDMTVTRCETFRLVAVGATGDQAVLKELPAPACSTG